MYKPDAYDLYTKLIIKLIKIDYQNDMLVLQILIQIFKRRNFYMHWLENCYLIIYRITYLLIQLHLPCIRLMLLKYMANSMTNKLLIYPFSRIYILIKLVFLESIRVTVMLMHYTHFECLIIYLITSWFLYLHSFSQSLRATQVDLACRTSEEFTKLYYKYLDKQRNVSNNNTVKHILPFPWLYVLIACV